MGYVTGVTSCELIISAKCQTGVFFPMPRFLPEYMCSVYSMGTTKWGISVVIRLFSSPVVQVLVTTLLREVSKSHIL